MTEPKFASQAEKKVGWFSRRHETDKALQACRKARQEKICKKNSDGLVRYYAKLMFI